MSLYSLPTTKVGWSGSRRDKQGGIRGPRENIDDEAERHLDFHARVRTEKNFWSNLDWETCCVSRSGIGRSAVFDSSRMARVSHFFFFCAPHFFQFTGPGRVVVMS